MQIRIVRTYTISTRYPRVRHKYGIKINNVKPPTMTIRVTKSPSRKSSMEEIAIGRCFTYFILEHIFHQQI